MLVVGQVVFIELQDCVTGARLSLIGLRHFLVSQREGEEETIDWVIKRLLLRIARRHRQVRS